MLKILISGSGGFVGKALVPFLEAAGHEITSLSRGKGSKEDGKIFWDPDTGTLHKEDFEDFDAVIHLAGKNIASGRWTKKRKQEFFLSRCRDTWLLSQVLLRLYRPPKTLISASAIGIYGNRGKEILTEESARGRGFLADLCVKWEEATIPIANRGTRVVNTRFGTILGRSGGMLGKMIPLFKLGLGGYFGSGQQIISWVAFDDVVGAINHALHTDTLEGPVNITAPHPVSQREFVKILAKKFHRPAFCHIPGWALKILVGKEMAEEMLLSGSYVLPEKLLKTGYQFKYPTLEEALESAVLLD